ncbi:MAG: hypothetical protein L3K04_05385, partial [Thermoplasmata archaeon]|nr:hypothetical protein [Thermoplasmata archaeon]
CPRLGARGELEDWKSAPKMIASGEVEVYHSHVAAIAQIAKNFSQAIAIGDFAGVMDFYSPDLV